MSNHEPDNSFFYGVVCIAAAIIGFIVLVISKGWL